MGWAERVNKQGGGMKGESMPKEYEVHDKDCDIKAPDDITCVPACKHYRPSHGRGPSKGNGSGADSARVKTGEEMLARGAIQNLMKQIDFNEKLAVRAKYGGQRVDAMGLIVGNQQTIMKALIMVLDQLLALSTSEHEIRAMKKEEADAAAVPNRPRVTL